MTRKKKSRSLKRIHSVKTGNISKLKRSGTTDRQNSNLKTKSKPKSVYQKFLDENPDAVEKQIQPGSQPSNHDELNTNKEPTLNESSSKQRKPDVESNASVKSSKENRGKESKPEKEPDLLSQLDNKNFNDFY
jgi:hypothetical protein